MFFSEGCIQITLKKGNHNYKNEQQLFSPLNICCITGNIFLVVFEDLLISEQIWFPSAYHQREKT